MANLDYISHQIIATANGTPIPGAKINYYLTGTTTPQNTYSDAGLTTPNANPVICDANGVVPKVYLAATRYKRSVTDAANVSLPQYDVDPLDASQEYISLAALPSPTYPFLRVALTSDLHTYRRNAANSAWIDEGLTDALVNAATISEQLIGTSATLSATPDSVAALWQRGANIPSAATIALPATGGRHFTITGALGVSGISSAQGGRTVELRFTDACLLTHDGTTFILPGAANFTTAAGDVWEFTNEALSDASGSSWRCTQLTLANGAPLSIGTALVATQVNQESGTNLTTIVTPGRQRFHPSAAKYTAAFDASSGTPTLLGTGFNHSSYTDNGVGDFTVNVTTSFSGATYVPAGITQRPATNSGATLAIKQGTAPTASALRIATVDNGATPFDSSYSSVTIHGDQ